MNGTMTAKQVGIFVFIMTLSMKLLSLPSEVFLDCGNMSIFLFLIFSLIDFFILFLIIQVKKRHPNETLYQILSRALSKYVASIVMLVLSIYFILMAFYVFQSGFSYLRASLFDDANIIVYLFCMLPIANILFFNGARPFFRTMEIFFWPVVIGLILCLGTSFFTVGQGTGVPINKFGIEELLQGIFKYIGWFGNAIFLLVFIDKFNLDKKTEKTIYIYYIFASIILSIFMFAFFTLFGNTSSLHRSAISDIIQFNAEVGNVSRVVILALGVMMILLIMHSSMYTFCCCESIRQVFKCGKSKILFVVDLVIITCLFVWFKNVVSLYDVFTTITPYFALVLMFGLPIFLLMVKRKDKTKIKLKKEKTAYLSTSIETKNKGGDK